MERDFMGLGVKVKQKISKEITDSGSFLCSATGRSSTLLWSDSNKIMESIPQIMPFDSPNDENHKNLGFSANPQSPAFTSPFLAKNNCNDMMDITKIRNNTCVATGAPAQLTIFYAGSVCVFDDVSFEKAQAIMLLAGNGPPLSSPSSVLPSPVQTPVVQPSVADSSVANRAHNTKTSFSSQIYPTFMSNLQSVGRSVCPDDADAARNFGNLISPPSKEEPHKTVGSLESFTANVFSTGSVPQFRKASLARFLEKRKERVMNASPYSSEMNSSGSLPLPATS